MAEELVAALPSVLIMVAACFVVDAWQLAAISILRGMKVVKAPTVTTAIGYWLIGLPSAWVLMNLFGLEGVWGGLAVGLAATGLMLLFILLRELRRLEGAHTHSRESHNAAVASS